MLKVDRCAMARRYLAMLHSEIFYLPRMISPGCVLRVAVICHISKIMDSFVDGQILVNNWVKERE